MGTTMPESFEEMWAALSSIGRNETGVDALATVLGELAG